MKGQERERERKKEREREYQKIKVKVKVSMFGIWHEWLAKLAKIDFDLQIKKIINLHLVYFEYI